jgi:cyclic beta-1,2-glucan synthetase
VGVAAHPSNQPRLDAQGLTVVSGYGILQPRIVTALPAPHERTLYHWLFAGRCGLDPYSAASSEVYQDLFAEGSFSGKGLLNVQAMHAVLSGRLPEGLVLSHDLLEGALARCAAVSDITVIEGAPFHADVASARLQRWTRGDWQLLPFLLHPAAHGLRAIHLWKMADNLRRSLLAPAMLALLLLTLAGTGLSPWMALGLVLAALSGGQVLGALAGLSSRRESLAPRPFYRHAFTELSRALWAGLWQLAMLLQQTLRSLGAIGLALYRVFISHRRLLQWASAASVQASSRAQFLPLLRQHGHESLVALGLLGLLLAAHTPAPGLATALCLLWAGSPWWTWLASRPRQANARQTLSAAEQAQLHGIARDTWRYFERCVTAQEHDLPPDNLQTDPHDMVAHRTSPTNIGLYLLSTACAREFGWIGTMELLTRLEATLATLDGLQRHRGHFLNWYDTSTGLALMPLYVSTVDSGNFSGHLLAVAEACLELATAPLDPSASQAAIVASKLRLAPRLSMRAALSPAMRDELKWRLDDHRATLRSAEQDQLARTRPGGASEASLRLRAVARRCEQLAWAADFTFLYHPKRHLLHIGYRVATDELDASFYDLLASESRLTSLLAMARGDLPVRHWAALSRPFCAVGSSAGLLSWSGSMFEYLMPTLVIDEPWGSALQVASLSAVQEQITFAESLGLPWGISESAYAGRDDTLAYQYAPQGVPRLALRRTPPDELVVAPYATALAVQQLPHQACLNFDRLEALQARGRYGFIEALDFSPARQAGPGLGTPVHTFMAHHQGMSIVALANVLLGGPAQRWGMAPARLQAVSALLHEWSPHEVSVMQEGPSAEPLQRLRQRPTGLLRELLPGVPAIEPTQLLSNGRYHVSLRGNGAGWSHWGAIGLSRSRDDALRDACGSFFYLRTAEMDHPVSLTQHPAPDPKAGYVATFHADRVCFEASWPGWLAQITVWVSPEDDIEFRQVTLQNLGDEALDIELLSAFEPTLADPRADESHPAFSQLFLRTSWLAAQQALVLARTPRIGPDRGLYAAHFLTESDPQVMAVRGQTDRALWQGRHHDPSRIRARLHALPTEAQLAEQSHAHPPGQPPEPGGDIPLATALDTGLDPVCAMGVQLHILPHGKVQLTFATAACDQLATLHAVVDKYRQHGHVQRASLMSATLSGIRLRTLRISPENMAAIQSLNTALLLTLSHPGPQSLHKLASVDTESRSTSAPPGEACDRRLLWRFGLSGERPMIFVTVSVMQGLGLLRALTQALRLWSWSGLACDLVVVNDEPASYQMALQREIAALRAGHLSDCGRAPGDATMASSVPCGFHALKADEVSPAELGTLRSLARVRLHADGRPLARQVQTWLDAHELALDERQETDAPAVPLDGTPLGEVSPSQGHFEDGGRGFTFALSAGRRPPRPWLNVLANPGFGTHVSDAGAGCTWALNSRLNQLTAWSNDPVGDPPSELFLMQDVRSGEAWSLTPNAWGDDEAVYEVSHGQGRSRIRHVRGDVAVSVSWCVDTETAVKQVRVQVRNRGQRHQTLRLFGLVEWLMGAQRGDRSTVHSSMLSQHLPGGHLNALLSTQRERAGGFGEGTAFFGLSSPGTADSDWTCDRRELFDARGRLVLPEQLGRRSGSGLDPCAALSTELVLAPGERAERTFLLGYATDPDAARQLATQAASVTPGSRLARVERHWDQLLQATTVSTPDPLFDALVNRWLLYQTVACRMWAKAGFYQAGGATGFRDQLQDALALSWAAPEMLREQILLAASRQFPEGDVQHWWHSPGGAGVRTHFSDDLLWLPYACVHHLRRTGDTELLAQRVAFIDGPPVPPGAEDSYDTPTLSPQSATVYEHAARAIDRSLRVGQHGLPLMGTGDWNDGMNRVGQAGLGESVWLAWLLCQLVADFIPLAQARGEDARVAAWGEAARGWEAALNAPEGPVWDGHWYTRAFFDNGEPLGSHLNAEGRIDLIAQAWSLLSGMGKPAMQDEAMASADAYLVDHEAGLLRLLTPPFAHADPSPGYIQAYPPGVRENGGQYAHAGVWAMMAVARQAQEPRHAGDAAMAHFGDRVWRYFGCLSPAHRAAHPTRGPAYGLEPYVMAADVYSQPPWVGRGGWSWYTGSAAWMHRAAIESLFGLIVQGSVSGAQTLSFTPCLPSHWARAELTLRRDSRTMRFILVRAVEAEVQQMLNEGTAGTPEGARLLRVGEMLDWSALGDASCFMLPLLQGH